MKVRNKKQIRTFTHTGYYTYMNTHKSHARTHVSTVKKTTNLLIFRKVSP